MLLPNNATDYAAGYAIFSISEISLVMVSVTFAFIFDTTATKSIPTVTIAATATYHSNCY